MDIKICSYAGEIFPKGKIFSIFMLNDPENEAILNNRFEFIGFSFDITNKYKNTHIKVTKRGFFSNTRNIYKNNILVGHVTDEKARQDYLDSAKFVLDSRVFYVRNSELEISLIGRKSKYELLDESGVCISSYIIMNEPGFFMMDANLRANLKNMEFMWASMIFGYIFVYNIEKRNSDTGPGPS